MLDPDRVSDYVSQAALRRRLSVRNYLSDTVKDLRRFFTGFDAADGYNLSNIHTWTKKRADTVREYGEYLHGLQSAPYVEVSPKIYRGAKRGKFRMAIARYTGQGYARQKRYLWHVDQTARPTQVKLVKGRIEIREPVKKTYVFRRYWFFRDYNGGRQPVTFDGILQSAHRMLPDMPDHLWYGLFAEVHGVIDVPVQKPFIIQTLLRYLEEYTAHDGFAQTLLGFVAQGTRESAMKGYEQRLNRRMQREYAKSERAQIQRQRLGAQLRRWRRVR